MGGQKETRAGSKPRAELATKSRPEAAASPGVGVLDLYPGFHTPRSIGRIAPFRHDSLEPHAAGLAEHGRAIAVEVLAQQDRVGPPDQPISSDMVGKALGNRCASRLRR